MVYILAMNEAHTQTPLNVIDLYSGVGGLSLGAARAGFHVQAAVEIDSRALRSHSLNFPKTQHINEDVSILSGKQLLQLSQLEKGQLSGLIGGPPCQGFSTMGHQCPDDTRNNLFYHFFRLISEIEPVFFLAENVPGIMNEKYDPLRHKAFSLVEESYHILPPLRVVASEYGAPTSRTRYFFIGINKKNLKDGVSLTANLFHPADDIQTVNVRTALGGLPQKIKDEWSTENLSWRKVNYDDVDLEHPFFINAIGKIPTNVGHQPALTAHQKKKLTSGCIATRHSANVAARYNKLHPGQIDRISKSQRLDLNGYCPTLRAGTGADKGSFQAVRPIHPTQARVITPREAARLQGFPDWFVFDNTKWHSFRQIGNSVSPIVAESIFNSLKKVIV